MLSNKYFYTKQHIKTQPLEISIIQIKNHLEKAKQGNQKSFSFLLNYFWNQVYLFQIKRVKNEYEAEEITIETFSKAFDKLEQFDNQYAFSTWLISISKNIQIDRTRKKNAQLYTQLVENASSQINAIKDHNPTPEDLIIKKQRLEQLLLYIKKLKPPYQEIIQLFYFQELSYLEISDTLQEPLNNVKVRLLRARKLLADMITKNHL